MKTWRIVMFVWLIAGVALLLHDAMTGGGIAGYLQYRELIAYGEIDTATTYAGLAVPLVVVPAFILMPRRRGRAKEAPMTPVGRRKQRIISMGAACLLVGLAILAVCQVYTLPASDAPVVRLAMGTKGSGVRPPANVRVVLRGTPRLDRSVQYTDMLRGRHGSDTISHNFVAMTEDDWTPDRPVRFITDLGEAVQLPGLPWPGVTERDTRPGALLSHAIPDYLRRAFAARGIVLAQDVLLHRTDVRNLRQSWFVVAIVPGALAVLCLLGGFLIR